MYATTMPYPSVADQNDLLTKILDSAVFKTLAVPFSLGFMSTLTMMVMFTINPWTLLLTIPMVFCAGYAIAITALS